MTYAEVRRTAEAAALEAIARDDELEEIRRCMTLAQFQRFFAHCFDGLMACDDGHAIGEVVDD